MQLTCPTPKFDFDMITLGQGITWPVNNSQESADKKSPDESGLSLKPSS